MACKTCDHTMQRVNGGEPPVFWCPRCGTLKSKGGVPEFEAPKAIERAHDLSKACRTAVEDAAGAVNPAARLPTFEAMKAALEAVGEAIGRKSPCP